jgi:hypothetical protein
VTPDARREFCDVTVVAPDDSTHTCAKLAGHPSGSHECICGRSWWATPTPVPAEDEDYWSAAW